MQCQKFLKDVAHRKASRGTARDVGWYRDKMERCASTTGQRNMEKRALLNDGAEEVEKRQLASCPEFSTTINGYGKSSWKKHRTRADDILCKTEY